KFQQQKFARQLRRHAHSIKALGLLHKFSRRGRILIVSRRRQRLSIIGDEVVMHPARLIHLDAELSKPSLGPIHELFGFSNSRRSGSLCLSKHKTSETQKRNHDDSHARLRRAIMHEDYARGIMNEEDEGIQTRLL